MPASLEPVRALDVAPVDRAALRCSVADGVDPAAIFEALEGGPRGFWGRGARWAVWGRALDEIWIDGGDPNRFATLRREIERRTEGDPAAAMDRFFGGLSFLERPTPNGVWGGFPAARFIRPELLIEGDGDVLRIQVLDRAGGAHAEAEHWVREIEAGRYALRQTLPLEPTLPEGERSEERGEDAWSMALEAVLGAIRGGEVEKTVLARTRDVHLPESAQIAEVLRFLRHENPRAHVFIVEPDPGRVLFGAAPEVLAELRDGRFHATAVAGSAPRGRTPHEDQLYSGGLLASKKDRAEHRMTLDEMVEIMAPRLARLDPLPDGPSVLALARIQHLETPLRGMVRPGEDILSLVEALHPTPAVCGRPRGRALELIARAEPFERGWYAGPVGWLTGEGEGDFVPALRIGVGGGQDWRLYAGAGVVEGSDPRSEWEETALKFEPAHRALRGSLPNSLPG